VRAYSQLYDLAFDPSHGALSRCPRTRTRGPAIRRPPSIAVRTHHASHERCAAAPCRCLRRLWRVLAFYEGIFKVFETREIVARKVLPQLLKQRGLNGQSAYRVCALFRICGSVQRRNGIFADPQFDYHEAVQFYRHEMDWSNRLILGDSLQVMASLAQREDLAGKVQVIYVDPPYGINFGSNFQPQITKRTVQDKEADLTREAEAIRAFRDTWNLGIHSYLTYFPQHKGANFAAFDH